MNIFYRVDNRLVHGQIISTWMPHLRVKTFVIVNDDVPGNELRTTMFRMAIPPEHKLLVLSIDDAAQWLNAHRHSTESILVLIESIDDAVRLFQAGHPFPQLNIGNVHHAPGRRSFTPAVYLSDDDLDALRGLQQRGLRAEIQSLPTETPMDMQRALEAT